MIDPGTITQKDTKLNIEAKQAEIDNYNEACYEIPEVFNSLEVFGHNVIVKLFKENYIKNEIELPNGDTMYDAWIGQVEVQRMGKQGAPTQWIDSPLPYVFSGVVMAISPEVVFEQAKKLEAMKEFDKQNGTQYAANKSILKVGDTVQLQWFNLQQNRYYVDKQKFDLIKNPEEFSVDNYEGYAKVHYTDIEAIIKNK